MPRLFGLGLFGFRGELRHLGEQDMIDFLDGELEDRRGQQVRRHLEACWACRAKTQRTQEAITHFAEFVAGSLTDKLPPPPGGWSSFRARLQDLARSPGSGHPNWSERHAEAAEANPRRWLPGLAGGLRRRPARLGFAISLLGAAGVGGLLFSVMQPTVSATQVLDRARLADAQVSGAPGVIVRRAVRLGFRLLPDGKASPRGRVEVWRNAARGITVRRLYDESNRLVAGEWRRGASRTVYRRGEHPTVAAGLQPTLSGRDVWLWDATVEDFRRFAGRPGGARVAENGSLYVVSYAPPEPDAQGLVKVELTITRDDFRVVGQKLVLREEGRLAEYSLTEAGYEIRPASKVAERVFEPDSDLQAAPVAERPLPARAAAAAPPPPVKLAPAVAAAREIEATYELHRVGIDPPAEARLTVGDDGRLDVAVSVSDEARIALLSEALAGLAEQTRLRLEVAVQPAQPAPVQDSAPAPAHDLIARHLRGLSPPDPVVLDRSARLFARWVVDQSAVRVRSAEALRYSVDQWPLDVLAQLDLESLAKWQTIVRDHVRAIARDTEVLGRQLGPLFAGGRLARPPDGESLSAIQDVRQVPDAVRQLVAQIEEQHELVRALFHPAAGAREVSKEQRLALLESLSRLERSTRTFEGPWWLGQ